VTAAGRGVTQRPIFNGYGIVIEQGISWYRNHALRKEAERVSVTARFPIRPEMQQANPYRRLHRKMEARRPALRKGGEAAVCAKGERGARTLRRGAGKALLDRSPQGNEHKERSDFPLINRRVFLILRAGELIESRPSNQSVASPNSEWTSSPGE